MNWNERYAAFSGYCTKCGTRDDGTFQTVSGGECRDKEACEAQQALIASGAMEKPAPPSFKAPRKPRKPPYVDRKGNAPCMAADCRAEGKKYNAHDMHWIDSSIPQAFCDEHMPYKSIPYKLWQSYYKRRR